MKTARHFANRKKHLHIFFTKKYAENIVKTRDSLFLRFLISLFLLLAFSDSTALDQRVRSIMKVNRVSYGTDVHGESRRLTTWSQIYVIYSLA